MKSQQLQQLQAHAKKKQRRDQGNNNKTTEVVLHKTDSARHLSCNGMSHELPPSANWYSSSVCDWCAWSPSPLVAYAAKNEVRLFNPMAASFHGTLIGHSDRVTTLEFCVAGGAAQGLLGTTASARGAGILCATGSADQSVRVWDCESLACLHKLAGQHTKDVVGVSSCRDASVSSTIVSADKAGLVIIWDFTTGKFSKLTPLNTGATCVKCGDGCVAAVGFQNGAVVVFDVLRATVLHRLIGHEGEVHALDWAPPCNALPSKPSADDSVPDSWEEDEAPARASQDRGAASGDRDGGSSGVLVSSWTRQDVACVVGG